MTPTIAKATLLGLAALTLIATQAALAATPSAPVATTSPPAPAAAAAPALANGPLVAGVCLLSQEALVTRSRIGQAATARLRDLAQQAQANINAEKAHIEARGKALQAKRATLTPMQLEAEGKALNAKVQALQAQASERAQQIDATKSRAYAEVLHEAQPFIVQAYGAHACGLLLAREAALTGNMGNDLTGEVLAALDAKGTPVTFDLEPSRPQK